MFEWACEKESKRKKERENIQSKIKMNKNLKGANTTIEEGNVRNLKKPAADYISLDECLGEIFIFL